jgi:antitoxin (DNA-binding transcriptional repressor) of toxin-antitoxin stability system
MIVVNIHEAKARLSEYLEAVANGQRVVICKRNQPVAELRAVAAARTEPRPVGLAKGRLVVSDAFFEPLPASVVAAFEGGDGESFRPMAGNDVARAAERPGTAYAQPRAGRARGRRS